MNIFILEDFNNMAMRCLHMPSVGFLRGEPNMDFWAYLTFTHIHEFAYNVWRDNDHAPVEVILAVDSLGGYWRKDLYSPYKANRAEKMTPSELALRETVVYPAVNKLLDTIRANIPWVVLRENKCEADDVIAVLSKLLAVGDNKVIIRSSDSDYIQLVNDKVELFNPLSGYVTLPGLVKIGADKIECSSIDDFVTLSVMTGQSGKDNVYNIKTDTDYASHGKKKTPFGVVGAKKLWDEVGRDHEKLENKLQEISLLENYNRNNTLINLELIPTEYKELIEDSYRLEVGRLQDVNMIDFYNVYRWPSLSSLESRNDLAILLSVISGKEVPEEVDPMDLCIGVDETVEVGPVTNVDFSNIEVI